MSTKHVKIRILDEVAAVVVGLSDEHMAYLYDKYAVNAPNFFFNPKFKMGQWDGKIRYFHKTGRTFLYLLEDLLPRIVQLGYAIVLEDLRKTIPIFPNPITSDLFKHIIHIDSGQPITLRDDQVEAVNALINFGSGVCVGATGMGKTLSCAALVSAYAAYDIKSITIVPNQSLIRQTKAEYINCGLDTGEYSGTAKTLDHKHIVSTWQALKNNPTLLERFQLIITDECHGLRGNILQKLLTEHAAAAPYRYGFTGTLPKDESEKMSVHVAVGPVRYTMSAKELMDMGVLAALHIDILQLEEDLTAEYEGFLREEFNIIQNNQPADGRPLLSKPPTYAEFKEGYFLDFTTEKAYLQHNTARIEWIADLIQIKSDEKKGNVLCLVDSIPMGRKLASYIPGAIFVNGQDVKDVKKRQIIYDMFKDHDNLAIIATVNVAGTGLNIPRIFNLVAIDMGKSFIRVIQVIGRSLRKAADKDSVTVTEVCSDLKYAKKHVRERIKYYKEAQYPHKKRKIKYNAVE